ncbi:MAG: response regulator transcription factor [Clostridiales bacterium]|nr:response regulator transcription factor [Clostridiales bacterium]
MNKMRIAVCDDSQRDLQILENHLLRYADEKHYEFAITRFCSGREFLDKYQPVYHMIFLDIRLEDLSGDRLAECIREEDREVPVVFVSSFPDAVYRGYELNIQNYVKKPLSYSSVAKEVERAIKTLRYLKEDFFWEEGMEESLKIYYSRLEYIETDTHSHGTCLHYDGRMILSRRKLKDYENLLKDPCFYRCNYSYIVNLRLVEQIIPCDKRYELMLSTGEKIPMSRGNKGECMKRMMAVWGTV